MQVTENSILRSKEISGELTDKINEYSQKPLKNIYEVSVIIENTFTGKRADLFKDLMFTAKYINGLKSVLSNQIVNQEGFMERMFEEFNLNVQKFSEYLKTSVSNSGENVKLHFDRKYFEIRHDCLVNTMELIEDLNICKEYFNRNPEFPADFS